jgi:hypothetical protein
MPSGKAENSSTVASNIAAGMAQPWKTPQIASSVEQTQLNRKEGIVASQSA